MKKKIFSILLSLCMVVTMMPVMTMTSYAGTINTVDNVSSVKEGVVSFLLGGMGDAPAYNVTTIQNGTTYTMVNLFGSANPAFNTIKDAANYQNANIEINAADSNNVTIAKQNTGWEGKFFPDAYEIEASNGKLENGLITFAASDIKFYEGGVLISLSYGYGGIVITLPTSEQEKSSWTKLADAFSGEGEYTSETEINDDEENPLFKVKDVEGVRTITLLSDITAGENDSAFVVPDGEKVVLDLNGHVLNRGLVKEDGSISTHDEGSAIKVAGKLTIIDSDENAVHKGFVDADGCWHWDESDAHALTTGETRQSISGGIITGGTGSKITSNCYRGGGLRILADAAVCMEKGNIVGNKIVGNIFDTGGGISMEGNGTPTLDINGGCVGYNTAKYCGGIDMDFGILNFNGGNICHNHGKYAVLAGEHYKKFIMSGGEIHNNQTDRATVSYKSYEDNDSYAYLYGGTIRDNQVGNDYSAVMNEADGTILNLGGDIKIYKNFKKDGRPANIYMWTVPQTDLTRIRISDGVTPINGKLIPAPKVGMFVGINKAEADTLEKLSYPCTNQSVLNYFISDDENKFLKFNDSGEIVMATLESGANMIKMESSGNGVVYSSIQAAKHGDTVSLTVTPDEGYELDKLTYTYEGNTTPIDITSTKSFTMPDKAVIVSATFKESTEPGPTPPGPTPGPAPEPTPAEEEYKAPVEGENTVNVNTTITDGKAKVEEISQSTLEEAVNPKSGTETTDTIVIDLSQAKQDVTAVELTKKTLENLADVAASDKNAVETVTIQMKEATVELDAKTLETVSQQADGNSIVLVVDKTESEKLEATKQETLKDYNVNKTFEAYFESNGHRIHDFKGGVATVSVKFEPTQGSDVNNYKIYYLDDNAKMHKYATKYKDGMLVFATTHFSDYVIVYDGSTDVLFAKAKSSKGKIKLSWNGIDNATKYVVYGARCGHNYKKLKTTTGKSYTVKKISGKKLIAHKAYKFYVVAFDAVGNKVQSRYIHCIYKNTKGKYANVKSIKAKYDKLLLSVGVTQKIGAKYKMYSGKKHIKKAHGVALRYTSNNPDVATVTSAGTVKAVGKGTATIYIQDISGKYCKTKVTVE